MRSTVSLSILALGILGGAPGTAFSQAQYRNVDVQVVRQYRDAGIQYEKARALFAKKDFSGAQERLDACLEIMPDYADAHLLRAKILYTEKDYLRALAAVEQAKRGYGATASLRERMSQDRESEIRKRIQQKDADAGDLRVRLAQAPADQRQLIQSQIDRLESERATLDREIRDLTPGLVRIPAEYFFFHGNVLLRLGKYPESIEQYNEALKLDPGYGEAANNLASLYYSARQYEKAMEVVTQAQLKGATINQELKKAIEDGLRKR
jgi:tetratricopeptide (TPR) repeat protein